MRRAGVLSLVALAPFARAVPAQDSTVQSGVRIGITYAPGTRASLAVMRTASAAGLDSVRAILERDLDHSDRFEVLWRPSAGHVVDSTAIARVVRGGPAQVIALVGDSGGLARITVMDVRSGQWLHRARLPLGDVTAREFRLRVHALADDIVREVAGQAGAAATALLFVQAGRLWQVDADGHGVRALRAAGSPALSPAWAPDGRRIAYTAFVRSGQPIVVQDLASGARTMVPTTEYGLNITPSFAPDGRRLAFAHGTEAGTDIYVWEGGTGVSRLTVGRFADNLSPAWSPDGARIAFVSTRARSPQLYVMNADGTDQEVLARFDFGATGTTSSPAWSPDGALVAFHREVGGVPQVFVLDVAGRAVRQVTGSGRNEDPTWAPDGRHLAFVSTRGGRRDLWVVDLETGRLRQLTSVGGARLPAWSPRFTLTAERE